MPITPATIFFEDYFDSASPLDSYEPTYLDPPTIRGLSDHSFSVRRGEGPSGEDCVRFLPPTTDCPGCGSFPPPYECGADGQSICTFAGGLVRFRAEGPTPWYHVRTWIKVTGSIETLDGADPAESNWYFDQSWPGPGGWAQNPHVLSILMTKEDGYLGSGSLPGPWSPDGLDVLPYRPAIRLAIGGFYYNSEPAVHIHLPNSVARPNCFAVFPYNGSGSPWPVGEWVCVELAVGEIDPPARSGRVKLWLNGFLVYDDVYESSWGDGPYDPVGFMLGSGSTYGGLGMPSGEYPFNGTLGWHTGMVERFGDRRWGLSASFARVATADGPIGCHTRGGVPPDETPDPDAMRCTSADDYAGADEIKGECGRAICHTKGKTRESWETAGAGFPSPKSFWYRWTAPRDGRFLFRTRGSEVFNELSVHRHTGATPPPFLASADDDDWDPTSSTSAAVEVSVEEGVEYRIRVASASEGWIILDFGPPRPLVQDDGWSINESERETRTRVSAVGPVSGLAVEDDQVAAAANGAGALATMDPIRFGDLA